MAPRDEWSQDQPWFECRNISYAMMKYQDEFLNRYSIRNHLDLCSESENTLGSCKRTKIRETSILKVDIEEAIRDHIINEFLAICEKNDFDI